MLSLNACHELPSDDVAPTSPCSAQSGTDDSISAAQAERGHLQPVVEIAEHDQASDRQDPEFIRQMYIDMSLGRSTSGAGLLHMQERAAGSAQSWSRYH